MSKQSPYLGLHPSFIGSATVLNYNNSINTLKVAFTNSNMFDGPPDDVNIVIKPDKKDSDGKVTTPGNSLAFFFITDDSDGSGGTHADNLTWALATRSQILDAITTFYPAANNKDKNDGITWTVAKHPVQGEKVKTSNPTTSTLQGWLFTPSADFTLEPGDSLILKISNIKTNLPDGPSMAYMYIKYDDMVNGINQPNHFIRVGPLQKSPNYISREKVGIGTNSPNYPLSISSGATGPKISLWDNGNGKKMNGFGMSYRQLNYVSDIETDHVFYSGGENSNGTELMRLKTTGDAIIKQNLTVDNETTLKQKLTVGGVTSFTDKVGIGVTNPLYPLSIQTDSKGPKISLWDGGQKDGFNGLSISSQQQNYVISGENNSHVFYQGGDGSDKKLGTELMRIKGNKDVSIEGGLTVKGNVDTIVKAIHMSGTLGGSTSNASITGWSGTVTFKDADGTTIIFAEPPVVQAAIAGFSIWPINKSTIDQYFTFKSLDAKSGGAERVTLVASNITTAGVRLQGYVGEGDSNAENDNSIRFSLLVIGRVKS